MDIRQLELFLAVLECGSLSRAADRAYLSRGAVSLQLQHLAMELHTELFVRSGKRFLPTPAAVRLGELASELVKQARVIEQEFANDPSKDVRPFYLATGATALIHRLGRPLREMRSEFPDAQIHVTVSTTEDMVAGLLDRRFDLAIISLPFEEPSLEMIPVYEEELLIIRPAGKLNRNLRVRAMQISELAAVRFLLYPRRSNMRTMIEKFFSDLGIAPLVAMEADDTEVIKKLVEAGFGYSILPESALQDSPRFFETFRVPARPIMRRQALARIKSDYPRALTVCISRFLQNALAAGAGLG